jgi:hypothetical protein
MDLPRLATSRVRGQALTEYLGALLVGTVIIGVIAYFMGVAIGSWTASRQHNSNEAVTSALIQELYRDAQSAETPYLPPNDVGNHSNSDGHEIDFYQIGANHAGYFWGYCYKATAGACASTQSVGTLERYRFTWQQLPQNGGSGATAQGAAESTFTGFKVNELLAQADYADATKNPLAATYFQRHAFSFSSAKAYHWAYPGVVSNTNAAYAITLSLANNETRSFAVTKHHIVFGQTVLYGTATPTPNAMCVGSCPTTTTALTYQNPIAAAQSATVLEQNYGTRSTTPAQVYTISGCNGTATYSPASPLTPTNNGTGAATLTITPVKQVAPNGLTCTITATDNANQTNAIAVNIGKTYTPTSSGPGAGLSGQTVAFTASEQNYMTSPPGGFSASISGACNSITRTAASVSGGTETESWNVHFASTGGCTVVFTDVYGQTTQDVTNVACSSYGTPCALTVSPTAMTICILSNPCAGSQNVSVSEANQFNSFTINDSGCRSGSYATANAGSIGSGGGSFTVTAGTQKTNPNQACPVVVSDNNGQSATIAVTVDPPPAATPTPNPPLVNINNKSFAYYQECDDSGFPNNNTCYLTGASPSDPMQDGRFSSSTNSVSMTLSASSSCDLGPQADDITFQLEWYSSSGAASPSATYNFTHMSASGNQWVGPVSENVLLPRGAGTYDLSINATGDQALTSWSGTATCTVDYSISVNQLGNNAASTGP